MKTVITNEQVIDLENTLDKKNPFYPQVKLVCTAMQDWPAALDDTDDLLYALKGQMRSDLTRENLGKYGFELVMNLGLSGNAWRAETVTGMHELINFYPDAETLDEIMTQFNETAQEKIHQAEI